MVVVNLAKILKGKVGWVSLSADNKKIIAQAKTLKALITKLKKIGNPKGYITNVEKDYSTYIG